MVIKTKCLFLRDGVDPKALEGYGFKTYNGGKSYWRRTDESEGVDDLAWYSDTRRFVLRFPTRTSARKTIRHVADLDQAGLVETKPMYEWLCLFRRWKHYSPEKKRKVNEKLDYMNGKPDAKTAKGKRRKA